MGVNPSGEQRQLDPVLSELLNAGSSSLFSSSANLSSCMHTIRVLRELQEFLPLAHARPELSLQPAYFKNGFGSV